MTQETEARFTSRPNQSGSKSKCVDSGGSDSGPDSTLLIVTVYGSNMASNNYPQYGKCSKHESYAVHRILCVVVSLVNVEVCSNNVSFILQRKSFHTVDSSIAMGRIVYFHVISSRFHVHLIMVPLYRLGRTMSLPGLSMTDTEMPICSLALSVHSASGGHTSHAALSCPLPLPPARYAYPPPSARLSWAPFVPAR